MSLIDPFPRTAILVIVSSCKRFIELPLGPSNFPTKLNWKGKRKGNSLKPVVQKTVTAFSDHVPDVIKLFPVENLVGEMSPKILNLKYLD